MIELYLIRHADALPVGQDGITDDVQRPLSEEGRRQSGQLGRALAARDIGIQHVVSSPLRRAVETAEIMRQQWTEPVPEMSVSDLLAPGGKHRKLARHVRELGTVRTALLGHTPDLWQFAGWLIGGRKSRMEISKAGVIRIDFDEESRKKAGTLVWLLPFGWIASIAGSVAAAP